MIVIGRELRTGFTCSVDVCVVGSGSGGAVVAKELAESGLSVCVLEEGGHYTPEEYSDFTLAESTRRMYRDAGATMAIGLGDTPSVQIVSGRVVGGGSVLTGGVCFRAPEHVHLQWCAAGLDELAPKRMEPFYERVEEEIEVTPTPSSLRSASTELFAAGAAKLGATMKPIARNTRDCTGKGRCAVGCGKKRSVNLTYLPKARAHGAVIYSDCLVERVVIRDGRAVGVRGRVLGGRRGKPGARFEVHAKAVVVAAGSLHTPLLLRASGLGKGSSALGENLSLHPGFAVGAVSRTRLEGWRGAMQSAYTDHLATAGILLLSMFADPSMIASRMPGIGARHMAYAKRVPDTALFAGLLCDRGRGKVRRGFGREPIITYRMRPEDRENFVRGFCFAAEMALEGGATEVMLPVRGLAPVRSVDELRRIAAHPPAAARFHAISFHPLCTARMGNSPTRDVVAHDGETHEVENLFVADGSVFRSPPGVNAQVPIMASATRIAWALRDSWVRRCRGGRVRGIA